MVGQQVDRGLPRSMPDRCSGDASGSDEGSGKKEGVLLTLLGTGCHPVRRRGIRSRRMLGRLSPVVTGIWVPAARAPRFWTARAWLVRVLVHFRSSVGLSFGSDPKWQWTARF